MAPNHPGFLWWSGTRACALWREAWRVLYGLKKILLKGELTALHQDLQSALKKREPSTSQHCVIEGWQIHDTVTSDWICGKTFHYSHSQILTRDKMPSRAVRSLVLKFFQTLIDWRPLLPIQTWPFWVRCWTKVFLRYLPSRNIPGKFKVLCKALNVLYS